MDIDTDDNILQVLAAGKSMDYEQWPGLLSRLLPRLEKIVHEDFIIPKQPPPPAQPPSSSPPDPIGEPSTQTSTQSTDKENAEPTKAIPQPEGRLPPYLQNLYLSITSTLTSLFSTHPPHTIQRLAELILSPKQHYRTLPAYLHALDRVVHVSSGAHVFPLPPAIPDPSSFSNGSLGTDPLNIAWSNPATTVASSLGSDESLGGALLTPIPWLTKPRGTQSPMEGEVKTESTEMIEGPNGPGGVETVSVSVNGISSAIAASTVSASDTDLSAALREQGGITQGELLRQEQKAGVVPAVQLRHVADSDGMGEDDEMPHARGPEEIGMEDMGPQNPASGSQRKGPGSGMQGIDIEAAIGRKLEPDEEEPTKEDELEKTTPSTPKREADEEMGSDEKRAKGEDVDMEITDVDGKTTDEPKVGDEGETKGPDAIDTSTV